MSTYTKLKLTKRDFLITMGGIMGGFTNSQSKILQSLAENFNLDNVQKKNLEDRIIELENSNEEPLPPDPPNGNDPSEWPNNEPPNLDLIFHSKGDSLDFGSNWSPSSGWNSNLNVINDPKSRYGKAIEKVATIGDSDGWLNSINVLNKLGVRELYLRFAWILSTNYQFHKSGYDKLFLYGRKVGNKSPTQFVITQNQRRGLRFTNQSHNSGAADFNYAGTFQVDNLPGITRGQYHTVELHHILNTKDKNDGSFRLWLDDLEALDWKLMGKGSRSLENVEWIDWDENKFGGGEFFLFWGGQGDTKRVNDHMRLSELYISGR